ncbi:MAG: hypothetical protein FJX76_01965 [Armatimonadetes bacterium]|nr:hypothetical protein [Armatimonadota bacterium]
MKTEETAELPPPPPQLPFPEEQVRLDDGTEVVLRQATTADMNDIKQVYFAAYGGRYTLSEVNDGDKMKWCINDPNYLWLVNRAADGIVCSVIFVVDPKNRISKTFGGVVHPDWRGHKMMVNSVRRGMEFIVNDRRDADLMYAIVRTFVSPSFHTDLNDIGFIDLGVFPNVRKVKNYETHGFKVCFGPGALERRRPAPSLHPAANLIYQIVRGRLGLEPADVEKAALAGRPVTRWEMLLEKSRDIEWEYYQERDAGRLLFDFFPFHYPHVKLYTRDESRAAYLHYQEKDGHASLLGLCTPGDMVITDLLSVADYAESMGVKYLELLVNAHDPLMQRLAYEAGFLPTAYFPAARLNADGQREDYIVTSCTFVPPHFKGLRMTPSAQPYLQAYYKIYTTKLWEDMQ